MEPVLAVARTAQARVAERPTIAALCRPIAGGRVEPEFVADEIARQGFSVVSHTQDSLDVASADVLIFLGNAAWWPNIVRTLRRLPRDQRPFVAVWHWEPLPPPQASNIPRPRLAPHEIGKALLRDARATDPYTNAYVLRRMLGDNLINFLAVSTRAREEYLAQHGWEAAFVPLGYGLQHGECRELERDIDLLFLGDERFPRRRRTLRAFRAAGLDVTVAGGWSDSRFWGESRTALLNRAKILLNVPRSQGDYSGLRFLLGAANGAMLLSEPLYRPEPFLPGEHYVEAATEELPQVARLYLEDASKREDYARAAHRLATEVVTRERSVARLMNLLEQRRSAPAP